MKRQIYNFAKLLFVMTFMIGSIFSSMSQNAKVEFFNGYEGYYVNQMSTNGRYIVLGIGNVDAETRSYVWDRETSEFSLIGYPCTAEDVSDDGIVVGGFKDPEYIFKKDTTFSGGWWQKGVWHSLGGHPDQPIKGTGMGSVACAITNNGEYIGGYVSMDGALIVPCVWKRNANGGYDFHKEYAVTSKEGQGGRVIDISDDGQIACGWDSPKENESWWTPAVWTTADNKMYKPTGYDNELGIFFGLNPAGTIAVGGDGDNGMSGGLIFYRDGSHKLTGSPLQAISATGMAVGYGIWTEELGDWNMSAYLKTFWNTDASVGLSMAISGDGKYIAGFIQDGVPYTITFEGDIAPVAPINVTTALGATAKTVDIAWRKPYFNGKTINGYNVYRGSAKINSDLITDLTFTDVSPEVGRNCYSVEAVYQYESATKTSPKSVESCIEILAAGGCYSPKNLVADVIYNKTVNLSWDVPAPNYNSSNRKSGEASKLNPAYMKTYSVGIAEFPAADNDFIYVLEKNANIQHIYNKATGLFKRNLDFPLMDEDKPAFGLTYDGTSLYATNNEESYKNTYTWEYNNTWNDIVLKTEKKEKQSYLESARVKKHITYIPTLDANNGGFEIGNETESWFYKKDLLTEIGAGLQDISNVCGTAYYEGKIYASIKEANKFIIKVYDATTGVATGEYIDLADYTEVKTTAKSMLGGISIFKGSEGLDCLAVVIVNYYENKDPNNDLVILQIEESAELLGYNLFRNGEKLNASLLKDPNFTDVITEGGEYEYHVNALFGGNCTSKNSLPVTISITPIGTCNAPANVKAEIIRNNVQLTWTRSQATPPNKLVGYNIYRDGVKINNDFITNTFYTDTELELNEYTYQIESFYNNSCTSEKTAPLAVKVFGYNDVTPPTNLSATVDNIIQASLNWNEPALGDYTVLKWHNGGAQLYLGEDTQEHIYVGSKWDANDLKSYFDYSLTDIEFFPKINTPHTFYVYLDGEVVAQQELNTVTAGSFNLLKLDTPVLIEKGKELLVAYKVKGGKDFRPIGADKLSVNKGKGDLISYDGKTWKSLFEESGVGGTWTISIRLMPYSVAKSQKIETTTLAQCAEGKIVAIDSDAKSEAKSVFVNKEVTGYNIYKDDVKINTSLIKTTSYTATIDNTSNSCFAVEAVFTRNRISPKTETECIYGQCKVPTNINGKASNPNSVVLTWTAPIGDKVEDIELKYYDGEVSEGRISFQSDFTFYAFIQSTVAENYMYNNLLLKSVDAFILEECPMSLIVIQDGIVLVEEPITKINSNDMNTFILPNGGQEIDVTKNILIGLKLESKGGVASLGIDASTAVSFRGDVISQDGKTLSTIYEMSTRQINNNWCISANFEQITPTDEKVTGYNVYRNGTKINTTEITSPVYTDNTTEIDNNYDYAITTLWSTGCESELSEAFKVSTGTGVNDINASNISIFPNPAKNRVNIRGDYNSLKMYNSTGSIVLESSEKSDYVDISTLSMGVYIIEIYSQTGVINRTKLVVTK